MGDPTVVVAQEGNCWHFDHSEGRNLKGINLLSLLYATRIDSTKGELLNLPHSYELIDKLEWESYVNEKGQVQNRRVSSRSRSERLREMLLQAMTNQVRYRHLLADSWFSGKENTILIKSELGKGFVMLLKTKRKVAFSRTDKLQSRWKKWKTLTCPGTVCEVWLEGVDFALLFAQPVFPHQDGTAAALYLVNSDTIPNFERLTGLYQRR